MGQKIESFSAVIASEEGNRVVGRTLAHSLVIILFFLSGASSLIYEILWMRMFTQVFGSTTTATATVLSAFMAGLALGSYLIGSYADRHPQSALRLYAYLEGMIGIFGLSMPFLIKALYSIYGWIFTSFGNDYYILGISRFFLSLLLILIPTTFMGATLPVLSKHFVFSHRTLCRWVGVLYGVNTFGAVVGSFISGFFLIEWLGVTWSIRTAALTNFVIAAFAIMLAGFGRKNLDADRSPPADDMADSDEAGDVTTDGVRKLLLAVCFGAGFMSLAFEVIWVRMLVFVLDSTVYAFCTMLTSFLFGIMLGGFLISALYSKIKSELRWLAVLETLIGISGFATIVLLARIPEINSLLRKAIGYVSEGGWWTTTAVKFFEAFSIMLIPTILMGMAFPLICKIYTRSIKQLGGSIGAVYAVNTFGAVLGSLVGGFLMIPLLGTIKSIAILSTVGIVLGGVLLFTAPARIAKWFYGAVALTLAACLVFTWTSDDLLARAYSIPEPGSKLAYYHEGRSGTITIHVYPGEERVISVNATNVAGTQFGLRTTQKLQAHIPMLVHGQAKRVLQIGFGSGESCHVLSTYPVEQIDLVEIDADVLKASDEFFLDLNQGVVSHPKFNPIIMDGKNYALLSDEKYDVIMNDSTFPGKSGSASLYTRDHFLACRERLNEGGVMSSWVPFELWPSDFQNIVKTFQSVFPNTTLWLAGNCRNKHALLLGTVGPFQVDFDRVVELMEIPAVKADLDEIRLGDPYVLMGSLALDPTTAERYSRHAPISSDEHPTLEFTAGRHFGSVRSWRVNHEDFLKYRASIIPHTRFSKSDPREADIARQTLARVEKANIHIDRARLLEFKNEAENNFLAFRMITLERRKEYDRALELYPGDENIPIFLNEGRATLYALVKMAKNNPADAQVLFELGCAYRGQRMYPEAIAALTKASELAGENDRYRKMLRQAIDESGKAE